MNIKVNNIYKVFAILDLHVKIFAPLRDKKLFRGVSILNYCFS